MIRACPDCGGPAVAPRAQYLIVACPCGYLPRVLPDVIGHRRACACACSGCRTRIGDCGISARDQADALAFALASLNVEAERRLMLVYNERPLARVT